MGNTSTGGHCPQCQNPPRPVSTKVIVLESADGLRSPRPVVITRSARSYKTAFIPAGSVDSLSSPWRDTASPSLRLKYQMREYRWHGKTDTVDGARVEVWQEEVDTTPKGVPVDKIESLITKLSDEAQQASASAVADRLADATHLGVAGEAKVNTLTNVVLTLKRLVKE